MPSPKVPRTCAKCGREFMCQAGHAKSPGLNYCSLKCYYTKNGSTPEERFWAKVEKTPDCWLWTAGRDRDGYGDFMSGSRTGARREKSKAHRVSYELHHGPIPKGQLVLHRCDNPPCVRAECDVSGCEHLRESVGCKSHLFLGTNDDNMRDKAEKGRGHGPRNPGAKLTERQVVAIRERHHELGNYTAVAREFGIGRHAVRGIVRRISYRFVN